MAPARFGASPGLQETLKRAEDEGAGVTTGGSDTHDLVGGGERMEFEYQPTLRGELVELRPLNAGDYAALYEVASDPAIWEQHPANRHEEPVFQEFFEDALDCGGTLVAMEAGAGRIIGSSRFHGYDADRREVEIGWTFLARAYWGGTYNGEMKRLMCEHAFKFAESVVLLIAPENARSQRAAEKIGAVREGTRPNAAGRLSCVYRIMAPGQPGN